MNNIYLVGIMLWEHWEYYLAIEQDLARVFRFIEPSPDNMKSYSLELSRIILITGSEIDITAKQLCMAIDPLNKIEELKSIDKWFPIIRSEFSAITELACSIPRFNIEERKPWQEWKDQESPSWWKAYNKVKHQRNEYVNLANLDNAIYAVMGLYLLLLCHYKKTIPPGELHFGLPTWPLIFVQQGVHVGGPNGASPVPNFFSD